MMLKRTFFLSFLALLAATGPFQGSAIAGKIGSDCTFNGKRLYGNVQIDNRFPDVKVAIVKLAPDLKVRKLADHRFPSACGEWLFVNKFPDFTVQFVKDWTKADIKIEYVDHSPGIP